jgi:hypothetical protein
MDTYDFNDGLGLVAAHKHSNGGGWVADSASVADNAKVYGNAWVSKGEVAVTKET